MGLIYKRYLIKGQVPRTSQHRAKKSGTKSFIATRKKRSKKKGSEIGTNGNPDDVTSLRDTMQGTSIAVIESILTSTATTMEIDSTPSTTAATKEMESTPSTTATATNAREEPPSDGPGPDLKPDPKFDSFQSVLREIETAICPCTDATIGDLLLMVLVLGLKYNWTWEAQIALFKGLNVIFGMKKVPVENKYSYLQIIEQQKDSIIYHLYCPLCEIYLGEKDKLKTNICGNCESNDNFYESGHFFISVSIESQLQRLLENTDIAELIMKHRFEREKSNKDAFEDIYDGDEYKKHFLNGGILSSPHNFSYSFFIDGVPLGKSSNRSLWPIYLTINELPPQERKKCVILAGLYVGSNEPRAGYFLTPFVTEANKLAKQGFKWRYNNEMIHSVAIPLICISDSMARYQLLNFQSFAAKFGCTFCYKKSTRTLKGQRYLVSGEKADERTPESTKKDLTDLRDKRETGKKSKHIRGVKGVTPLAWLLYFNLIVGFVVDHMHNIFLGAIKLHTELIFDSTRKKFWKDMDDRTGVEHLINVINNRMTNITPPSVITRTPRSLTERRLWKASEWRSWLLFYSLPCLHDLLKPKYFRHLGMLSKATYLLLKKSITPDELLEAHNLLLNYVYYFEKYFGETNMVYNIHLLTHITKGVQNWGPIWGHSAFLYEAENRYLLQFYKSPNSVLLQVARKYLILNSLPGLCSTIVRTNRVVNFFEDLLQKKIKSQSKLKNCVVLGKSEPPLLSPEEKKCLIGADTFKSYKKIIINGHRYSVTDVSTKFKNNNSNFCYGKKGKKIAVLLKILKCADVIVLLVRKLILCNEPDWKNETFKINHMKRISGQEGVIAIKPSDVKCPAIVITSAGKSFACPVPYGCSGD